MRKDLLPMIDRVFCVVSLLWFLGPMKNVASLHAEGDISVGEAARLIERIPTEIRRLSFQCRTQNPLFTDPNDKIPDRLSVADLFLAWDLTNDHYYSRQIQYADERGTEPRHVVVESWDGREQVHWVRYVKKGLTGHEMFGPEPEDPGTVQFFSEIRDGNLNNFKEMLFPSFPFRTFKPEDLKAREILASEIIPASLGLPDGSLVLMSTSAHTLHVHNPSGWIVEHSTNLAGGFIRLKLRDFAVIPATTAIFPATIEREIKIQDRIETHGVIHVDLKSIKTNDAVVFPKVRWRAETQIQDERKVR